MGHYLFLDTPQSLSRYPLFPSGLWYPFPFNGFVSEVYTGPHSSMRQPLAEPAQWNVCVFTALGIWRTLAQRNVVDPAMVHSWLLSGRHRTLKARRREREENTWPSFQLRTAQLVSLPSCPHSDSRSLVKTVPTTHCGITEIMGNSFQSQVTVQISLYIYGVVSFHDSRLFEVFLCILEEEHPLWSLSGGYWCISFLWL